MKLRYVAVCALALLLASNASAQQQLTREQILAMSIEELSDLPLEDLMQAVETLGVSSVDELFAMIMNKNVSSASKKEEDSFTSPLSSTVITREEMRTYGITTIEEAFRLIPGMIVTEKLNGVYDIQMRGLNNIPDNNMYLYTENSNTLMMIDGRPVHNTAMGAVNFDMLSIGIEDVERIEVVRGACGALYGANAVTGVINIITEHPNKNSKLLSGNIQMGSQDTYIGEVALRKSINDKLSFGLTFNMQERKRDTNKLYVMPNSGMFLADNLGNMPVAGSLQSTPYHYVNDPQAAYASILQGQDVDPSNRTSYYDRDKFLASIASYQTIFGSMTDISAGGWFSLDEIQRVKQIYPTLYNVGGKSVTYAEYLAGGVSGGTLAQYRLFNSGEPEALIKDMFKHPEKSRSTMGFNGYLNFTPTSDMRFYLSAGYQNSDILTTPVGDDIFSLNSRTSKTTYVALDANVYDFHAMVNYMGGSQDYAVGVAGFKVHPHYLNISGEYDINLDCGLGIRPGVYFQRVFTEDYTPVWDDRENYKWHYEDPGYRLKDNDYENLTGFFQYTSTMTAFAPSIRLDYQHEGFRLIGAFRSDKTNIPDKWNPSWQFGASYSINDRNFVRVVYGRSNRGTNMVNTSANYRWTRSTMVYPSKLSFHANEDADLVKIDNVELGYRWKPAANVLVDAEAFYSKSSQYGALMADEGAMNVTVPEMNNVVTAITSGVALLAQLNGIDVSDEDAIRALIKNDFANNGGALTKTAVLYLLNNNDMGNVFEPYASIKYNQLPYEVKQMGLSFNIDYIISSKLIAKLNANFQKTTIDKYYSYSQSQDVLKMLMAAQAKTVNVIADPSYSLGYNVTGELGELFKDLVLAYADGMTVAEANAKVQQDAGTFKGNVYQYGVTKVTDHTADLEDGHEHKATPSFYGMLGLIYKPIQKLEVSAFANVIGKRTYATTYGSDELGTRFTVNMKVGYKPIEKLELFFNAHNLFNNQKREFSYTDRIGGIYTFGVNFGF